MAEMHTVIIPAARHEPTDIGERFVWIALAAVLGLLALSAVVVLWLYPQSRLDRTLTLPLPVYPAPRLQPDPPAELAAMRAAQLRALESTGWVDKAAGVVHIPIQEAIRQVAKEGIPAWPPAPDAGADTRAAGADTR